MALRSYEVAAFDLVCNKCGEYSEWLDNKTVAIENVLPDGWTVKYDATGRVVSCFCPSCSEEGE